MRIGVLSTSFPTAQNPIAGVFVAELADALAARGHDVHVLAPEPRAGDGLRPRGGTRVTPVRYAPTARHATTFYGAGVPDNLRTSPTAWLGALSFPCALAAVTRRIARDERWDAVLGHWALPCGAVAASVRRAKARVVVFHSADVTLLERMPARGHVLSALVSRATALVFVTERARTSARGWLARERRAAFDASSTVLPMGFTPARSRERAPRTAAGRPLRVLVLGRLVPIKAVDVVVEAVRGLTDVEVVVVGDGPSRAALEARAAAVAQNVRFVGTAVGGARDRWLEWADVSVLASRRTASGRVEGLSTGLLVTMHAGLAPVVTSGGGSVELVDDGVHGLVVPPDRPDALRDALVRLRDDSDLVARYAVAAAARAAPYRWDATLPTWERLLGVGSATARSVASRPAAPTENPNPRALD